MMHLAQWHCQFCVMMSSGRMVFLDAQTAGRHSEPLALTFLSSDTARRCPDWILIPHSAPPLNVR